MRIQKFYLGLIYAFMSIFAVSTSDIKVVGPNASIISMLLKSYIPKILFSSLIVMAIYSFDEHRNRRNLYISIILGTISMVLTETYYVLNNFLTFQWLTTIPVGSTGGTYMPIYATHLIPLLTITIIMLYRKRALKMFLILGIVFISTYLLLNVRWNGLRLNKIYWVVIELFTFFMSFPIAMYKTLHKRINNETE